MRKERTTLKISVLEANEGQLPWLPTNPRQWTQSDIDKTRDSILRDADFLEDRPLLVTPLDGGKYVVFAGNLRREGCKAAKVTEAPVVIYYQEGEEDKATIKRRSILDNGSFGAWDYDTLANEWGDLPLTDWGVPAWEDEPEPKVNDKEDLSDKIDYEFKLEITCETESEQEKMYNELTERGFQCRILTL